jgi:hypothetical protein
MGRKPYDLDEGETEQKENWSLRSIDLAESFKIYRPNVCYS